MEVMPWLVLNVGAELLLIELTSQLRIEMPVDHLINPHELVLLQVLVGD